MDFHQAYMPWQAPNTPSASFQPRGGDKALPCHHQVSIDAFLGFNVATASSGPSNNIQLDASTGSNASPSSTDSSNTTTSTGPSSAMSRARLDNNILPELIRLPYHRTQYATVMLMTKPTLFDSRMRFMCTPRSERWPLTGMADFEIPSLTVRLYNQFEVLGLPACPELSYVCGTSIFFFFKKFGIKKQELTLCRESCTPV